MFFFRESMLLIGLSLLLQHGCVKRADSTKISHKTGEVSRSSGLGNACAQKEQKEFPKAAAYVMKVVEYIAQKNPTAFREKFSPDKFCVRIRNKNIVGAQVNVDTGEIVVFTPFFLRLKNDAQFAAAIAHELAHVTLGHGTTQLLDHHPDVIEAVRARHPEFTPEFFKEAEEYKSLLSESFDLQYSSKPGKEIRAEAVRNEIARLGSKVGSMLEAYEKKVKEAEAEIMKNDPTQINWMEQEADEVGFEFYLRAGLKPSEFFLMLSGIHTPVNVSGRQVAKDCAQRMLEHRSGARKLERGAGSHPDLCWRVHNLVFNELGEKKKSDYEELLRSARTKSIFPVPGPLEEAQAEIRGESK